jgi:hypothetical protein
MSQTSSTPVTLRPRNDGGASALVAALHARVAGEAPFDNRRGGGPGRTCFRVEPGSIPLKCSHGWPAMKRSGSPGSLQLARERATVGWFGRTTKECRKIAVDEQCVVMSLVGDTLSARP